MKLSVIIEARDINHFCMFSSWLFKFLPYLDTLPDRFLCDLEGSKWQARIICFSNNILMILWLIYKPFNREWNFQQNYINHIELKSKINHKELSMVTTTVDIDHRL